MKQLQIHYETVSPEAMITLNRGGTIYAAIDEQYGREMVMWIRPRCENDKWRAATNHSEIQRKIEKTLQWQDTFEQAAQDLDMFALKNDLLMVRFHGYEGPGNNRHLLTPEAFAVMLATESTSKDDMIPWWLCMSEEDRKSVMGAFESAYHLWVARELQMDRWRMIPTTVLNGLGENVELL